MSKDRSIEQPSGAYPVNVIGLNGRDRFARATMLKGCCKPSGLPVLDRVDLPSDGQAGIISYIACTWPCHLLFAWVVLVEDC